jgi:hypothetical protein
MDANLLSENVVINDLDVYGDQMVISLGNGNYFLIQYGEFNLYENSFLEAVHKVLYIESSLWLFGYRLIRINSVNFPIGITTGVPF